MKQKSLKSHSLPPAVPAGICALLLAAILAAFIIWASIIPLAVFICFCMTAPFFPQGGFFLPVISRGHTGKHAVAITFDDGPDPATTLPLLQLLEKHGLKAAFFIIGEKAEKHRALIDNIIEGGHEIGNHSYTHDPLLMLRSSKKIFQEIKTVQDILKKHALIPLAFRPPVGITNPKLGAILRQMEMYCLTFSCRGFDGGNRYVNDLAQKILKKVKPGDILLLHDVRPRGGASADLWLREVELLFCGLREKNIEVVPLAELIGRPVMKLTDSASSPHH
ncbi:MAG: polysaccharide deacetylase family protein [Pseudomonadota bacterium]